MLPNNFPDHSVCIVGLGYVGLTLAVVMAEVGFRVYGVDSSTNVIEKVASGEPHFMEAGLSARLKRQTELGRLTASLDWPEPASVSVYVVTVGTPLLADRGINLASIQTVASTIGSRMKAGDLVVLRSTVKVGVSEDVVKPALQKSGVPFDLAFCPERTVEGKALEELRYLPQIVGADSADATMRASQLFSLLTPTVVRVADLKTAETIKLINNTQRDLLFGFANEVAMICEDIGISASDVIQAGNMGYARAMMPLPGPVGGPCLEKDPYILAQSTSAPEKLAQLALKGRAINEELINYIIQQLASTLHGRSIRKIAVFGLAFKGRPETSDLRGTLAVRLIEELRSEFPDADIWGYDPAVAKPDVASLEIEAADSLHDGADGADIVIFQNNNMQFQQLDFWALSSRMRHDGVIYDMWNQFNRAPTQCSNNVQFIALGGLSSQ
jgi:UDP-N-acetyl-D-mannosaminuronic acid dehydrogenase